MNDLVERLRTHVTGADDAILDEAADRIEELEVALREISRISKERAESIPWMGVVYNLASAALPGEWGEDDQENR